MDLDTIGKVLLILFAMPILILLWSLAFYFLEDCLYTIRVDILARRYSRHEGTGHVISCHDFA
jgi:hypothetical protein